MILIELIHQFIYFICIFFSGNIFGIQAEKPSGAIKGIIIGAIKGIIIGAITFYVVHNVSEKLFCRWACDEDGNIWEEE